MSVLSDGMDNNGLDSQLYVEICVMGRLLSETNYSTLIGRFIRETLVTGNTISIQMVPLRAWAQHEVAGTSDI